MANDRWYNPGDNYILDDLSGFKIRTSRAKRIPGGQTGNLYVAPERWEAQQPQDLVKGVPDYQNVAIARPRQQNRFTVVATNVAAYTPRGGVQVTVDNLDGFALGDYLQVMLDNGQNYYPVLTWISGLLIQLSLILPFGIGGTIGDPPENLIVDLGPSGLTWFTTDTGQPATDDLGNTLFTP
jgi:hypothetical protein